MYRVIEMPLQVKASLVGKFLMCFFGNLMPRFQSRPLHLEIESTLNQMAQQGYFLLSSSIKSGKKGASEAILLIFAQPNTKPDDPATPGIEWAMYKTRQI